jgi:hypothetical protein
MKAVAHLLDSARIRDRDKSAGGGAQREALTPRPETFSITYRFLGEGSLVWRL